MGWCSATSTMPGAGDTMPNGALPNATLVSPVVGGGLTGAQAAGPSAPSTGNGGLLGDNSAGLGLAAVMLAGALVLAARGIVSTRH